MRITLLILSALIFSLTPLSSNAQSSYENNFTWDELSEIPPAEGAQKQLGLAAAFAGISDKAIIVTGGCNFPEKDVWDGGQKKFYSDIFVLQADADKWLTVGKIPYNVAYGASVDTPKGVLCIGGSNANGKLNQVRLLTWNTKRQQLTQTEYPPLPLSLTSCDATLIGNFVYLAGGATDKQMSGNHFLRLDISNIQNDNTQWEILEDFPGNARIQPVLIAQGGAESTNLYLFGGSQITHDQEPVVETSALTYNTISKVWTNIANSEIQGEKYALHGADGFALGKTHILFMGGVNYQIFKDAITKEYNVRNSIDQNDKEEFAQWQKKYFANSVEWYGFNKNTIVYNTITDAWSVGCEAPFNGTAGAKIVPFKKGWALINGEIKPGVRTNKVYYGSVSSTPPFGAVNWAVLLVYMLGMVALGFYFMRKSKNTDDFFKGGGRLPWWAVGISLFATMLSAITFMAIPAKAFATDWKYFPMAVMILVMTIPVIKYYLPFFRRLNVTTAYEYLEMRFNYTIRVLASSLFIAFMVARMALTLYLPSLALTTVTGVDIYTCILVMGLVTLVYCTMGGAEAVVWGDVIQGIILFGGALITVFFLITSIPGGLSEVMTISIDNDKFKMFDMSFDFTNATIWVILLGAIANNLISYTSDQTVIQRYISTTSEKAARKSILMNGVLSVVISVIFYFIGTGLYAFYKTHPESLNYAMQNTDSIFPHYIMAEMPMGMAGILIAAIIAATMSTVSSNVNSLSTAFTVDIYRRIFPQSNDVKQLKVARQSSVAFGLIGTGLAVLMASWNILSLLDFFNYLLGLLSSSVAALFAIGIFIPRIGTRSALIGFTVGNIALLCVTMFTNISFLLYGFIGIVLTVGISYIISLVIPNRNIGNINGYTWKTIKSLDSNNYKNNQ